MGEITGYLRDSLRTVLTKMPGVPADFDPEFETPNNPEHGDLATNAAMQLARHLRRSPRAIAEEIVAELGELRLDPGRVSEVHIAGAGFINFRFASDYVWDALAEIIAAGDEFGRSHASRGQTAIVEYVSANPTGPLTVGHGRNAVLGDTIANLLTHVGYEVTREYYFNDAGRQMRVLAESVRARYEELIRPGMPKKSVDGPGGQPVQVPESFPEDGYQGEYIADIARGLLDARGGSLLDSADEGPFKEAAEEEIFSGIEATLDRLRIHMDRFFNEYSLYESRRVWDVVDELPLV